MELTQADRKDLSPSSLKRAAERSKLYQQRGLSVDTSLFPCYGLEQTLAEIFRVLKPQGLVLFIEPNADHPYRRLVVDGGFMRRYFLQTSDESIFPDDLVKMMRQTGFQDARFEFATFRNRKPTLLGRTQSFVSRVPRPRWWDRFVHPWFILVGAK